MTSASVSNIPIQAVSTKVSTLRTEDSKLQSEFSKMMQSNLDVQMSDQSYQPKTVANTSSLKMEGVYDEKKPELVNKIANKKDTEKVMDSVNEVAKEVKQVIAEELDVSEDEIEHVMEELGLQMVDLLLPTNVASVVGEFKNCDETVELLLDQDFTNIMSAVKDLVKGLEEQLNMGSLEISDVYLEAQELLEHQQSLEGLLVEALQDSADAEEPMVESQDQEELPMNEAPIQETLLSETPENHVLEKSYASIPKDSVDGSLKGEKTMEVNVAEDDAQMSFDDKSLQQANTNQSGDATDDKESQSFSTESMLAKRQGQSSDKLSSQVNVSFSTTVDAYFNVETQVVEMETGEQVNVSRIIDQIVERVHTSITDEVKTMEMVLNPEGLGKIMMQVSEKEGNISARIFTQNEAVKEALENQMVALKEQLNTSSTKINSIEISVATHEFERNLEEGQNQQQEENARQQERQTRNFKTNNLDELSGLMSEEEELVEKIMRENGNSINYSA